LIANSNLLGCSTGISLGFVIDHFSSPPEQIGVKAAPSERRNKVIAEVNRPTFGYRKIPMSKLCRYISFEETRNQVQAKQQMLQFLKPEFLESFSESCEIDTP
jgi:hypothetical protein